jgi:hypothetical protein
MGVEPLTPAHIEAFCRLYRYALEAWEVTLLLAMDTAWMDEVAKSQEKPDA